MESKRRREGERMWKRTPKMRDMTQGSPAKHIFLFSLPLLLGNVLQQLYNMVDSWTVGNFTGDTALAAVGIAFPVVFLFCVAVHWPGHRLHSGHCSVLRRRRDGTGPRRHRHGLCCVSDCSHSDFPAAFFLTDPILYLLQVEEAALPESQAVSADCQPGSGGQHRLQYQRGYPAGWATAKRP